MRGESDIPKNQHMGTAAPEIQNEEPAVAAGIGFALLSATAFGAVAPLAKLAYDAGAEPLPLLGVRFRWPPSPWHSST